MGIEYMLIKGHDVKFVELVNGMLDDGWELDGNTFVYKDALCQVVTRVKEDDYWTRNQQWRHSPVRDYLLDSIPDEGGSFKTNLINSVGRHYARNVSLRDGLQIDINSVNELEFIANTQPGYARNIGAKGIETIRRIVYDCN